MTRLRSMARSAAFVKIERRLMRAAAM